MKIAKTGSSTKQVAYARRTWGASDQTKKEIALNVGYSPSVARSCVSKIESRPGYHNAMARLAADSNNLALAVIHEFNARGLDHFENKELISALNAISGAWEKFNNGLSKERNPVDPNKNRLKTIVLQRIENQVNNTAPAPAPEKKEEPKKEETKEDVMDF